MDERIKELRKALGLTQKEFGDRIGVKRNTITTYEMGRNEPIPSVISLICKEFNVNEDWLRFGTGEMFLEKNGTLDALAEEYNLSEADLVLVERFLKLDKIQRDAVIKYMQQIADFFIEKEKEEMTTEAAEAAYRQALGIAPQTKSTALSSIEGTPADSSEEADGVC